MDVHVSQTSSPKRPGFPWPVFIDLIAYGAVLPIAALCLLELASPLDHAQIGGTWGKVLSIVSPTYFESPIHLRPVETAAVMVGLFICSRVVCAVLRRPD